MIMKVKSNLYLLFVLLFISSCTEEFDLDLEGVPQRMMVEGLITNDTSRVWVKVSKTNIELGYQPIMVSGADIKIWSNTGDTLTLLEVAQGYYEAANTIGQTGNTYNLLVQYQGEDYSASSFMLPVPTLDSLSVKYTGVDRVRLFFNEPKDEDNFYLIRSENPAGPWNIIVISDKFIRPDIASTGLVLGAGRRVDKKNGISPFAVGPWMPLAVSMSSISEQDYNYFKSIEMQFSTNGGAYSPSPANPVGNISNNALGLFRASSISYITHYPDSI